MKKILVLALIMLIGLPVYAAPVQVTPGSPAAYKYFPRLSP